MSGQRQAGRTTESDGEWYAIRDDLDWAIEPWRAKAGDRLALAADEFRGRSRRLIESLFERVAGRGPRKLHVQLIDHPEQFQQVEELLASGRKLLNLDVSTPGTVKLEVCRLFGLYDVEARARALIGRAGYGPLAEQTRAVPAGNYLLVDDDISTGYTLDTVCRTLPTEVTIEGRMSLLDESRKRLGRQSAPFDVIDLRDLLLGSREGGLVVELPNRVPGRAPYMLPYVRPSIRARIPPSLETLFSFELWQLNEQFFAQVELAVGDLDPLTQTFLLFCGFDRNMRAAAICRFHMRRLLANSAVRTCADGRADQASGAG